MTSWRYDDLLKNNDFKSCVLVALEIILNYPVLGRTERVRGMSIIK